VASAARASTVRERVRRMQTCVAPGVCGLRWGRGCPSDRCCAPGCLAQKSARSAPIPSLKVPKSATTENGDGGPNCSVGQRLFSSSDGRRLGTSAPRLPAVLALAAMFCELQLPEEPVYGRRTTCTGSPWQRTGEASRLISKAWMAARLPGSPGLGSAWRGPMTAQADHGQLCSARRGTRPVSSCRDLVHLAP
jgi:hypothetical protein